MFGTSSFNLTWNEPESLRGPYDNIVYYVRLPGLREIRTNDTHITLTEEDGVIPGTMQTIGVSANVLLGNSFSQPYVVCMHTFVKGPGVMDVSMLRA